ncbi:alanine dehydrogenase [soil metagenome]
MKVGVPTEIKSGERRVGLTPGSVAELVVHGHEVLVQRGCGNGIGASPEDYTAAGGTLVEDAETIFAESEMVVKVKEPQAVERAMLRPGQVLFAYLHLAPDPDQTRDLVESGATCIAYETITGRDGGLPLLAPMSQVAGRLSVQAGAHALETSQGGAGVLLGGVPGVAPARVVVIGGGVVGVNAIEMAIGLGADVTVLDRDLAVLDRLSRRFEASLRTVYSTTASMRSEVLDADLVIGAVLVKGARAPKLVTAEMLPLMRDGSVLVDVAIDQGGCFETSRPTTHADPTYIIDGIVHYCVANMPGAVPRTSAMALNNATLPYAIRLADHGVKTTLTQDPLFAAGLNVHAGMVTEPSVAADLGYDAVDPLSALHRRD